MFRKIYRWAPLFFILVFLSGCTPSSYSKPIDPVNGGWWDKVVYPVSVTLDWFADLLWGQYGLSIMIVTIIVRLIILPLSLKQYRSSKQMQAIQPELKKLKEKYKNDTKKQQEETMKLFQQHGVNPLAGCFPLIIQMPILIALYHAIIRDPEIKSSHFLWLELGAHDPFVLPILAAITTFVQQKIMSSQNPMNSQMKGLMYVFPVLIFIMARSFPSALPLYWVCGNLFMIVQTYFIYGRPNKGGQHK